MSIPNTPPPVPGGAASAAAIGGPFPMGDVEIDWDAALKAESESGYQPLPDGEYLVKVASTEVKPASTGSPMVIVQLTVCDGGPYNNKGVRTNFVYKTDSAPSMGMFANKVQAFGLTREWITTQRPSLYQIAAALIDRQAKATVIRRKNPPNSKNEWGNEVTRLSPASGTPVVAAAPAPAAPAPAPVAPTPTAEAMAQATVPVAPVSPVPATPPLAPAPAPAAAPPPAPAPAPAAAEAEDDGQDPF